MSINKFTQTDAAGFVYFLKLQNEEGIKIGRTTRIDKRLAEHRKNFEFEVIQVIYTVNCIDVESEFHEYFKEKRIEGEREVFDLNIEEIEGIKNLNLPSSIKEILESPKKEEKKQKITDFNILFGELAKQLVDEVDTSREEIIMRHMNKISFLVDRLEESVKVYSKFESIVEKGRVQVVERGITLDEKEKQVLEKSIALEEWEVKLKIQEKKLIQSLERINEQNDALSQREIDAEKAQEIIRMYLIEAERYLNWDSKTRIKHYINSVKDYPNLNEFLHYIDPWKDTEYKGMNKHIRESFERQVNKTS